MLGEHLPPMPRTLKTKNRAPTFPHINDRSDGRTRMLWKVWATSTTLVVVTRWEDAGGLDLFQDSTGSTVPVPRRQNGFGIPIPPPSLKDVGSGPEPPPAQLGQDTTAEAEGRSVTAKIVNHRASLAKLVDEQTDHRPEKSASDLVRRVSAHRQIRAPHAAEAFGVPPPLLSGGPPPEGWGVGPEGWGPQRGGSKGGVGGGRRGGAKFRVFSLSRSHFRSFFSYVWSSRAVVCYKHSSQMHQRISVGSRLSQKGVAFVTLSPSSFSLLLSSLVSPTNPKIHAENFRRLECPSPVTVETSQSSEDPLKLIRPDIDHSFFVSRTRADGQRLQHASKNEVVHLVRNT